MSDEVGHLLQRQREAQRLSLEAVSRSTRIAVKFLLAMEQERWEHLPVEVYRLGFLRRYATFLGLDAEGLLQRFRTPAHPQPPTADVPPSLSLAHPSPRMRRALVFLGVGMIVLLLWLLSVPKQPPSEPPPQRIPPLADRPLPSPAAAVSSLPALEIVARELTWLRVATRTQEAEEVVLFEGLLPPQAHRRWTSGTPYLIRIGNAKGVRLQWNGQPIDVVSAARGNVAEVVVPP